jgi:hypothetical protein
MASPPSSAGAQPAPACAACGAPLAGRFCARCGAPAAGGDCQVCHATLSPGARFCHRCGAPVPPVAGGRGGNRERTAWIVAGIAALVALLAILWRGGAFHPAAPPDMGNVGNVGAAPSAGLAGRAPDISSMSPRERFDRLFERVIRASEAGDSLTVLQFAPMALGAYAQLDAVDTDARYHAAMIDLAVGDLPGAVALADTILAGAPGHLFAYLIRGESADRRNDTAALTRSYRDFLDHYDAEMRSGRVEYAEHRPALDDFRTRARASLGR